MPGRSGAIGETRSSEGARGRFRDRLERALEGEVRFDRFTRGLYSTDASIYEIEPLAVGFPRSAEDVRRALEVAGEAAVPITPRGAGTSMAGQAIGSGLVLDTSRHLTAIRELDPSKARVVVEPGVVLDDLNRFLAPHGLFFPVDVATSSRATIGGMAGNNSAGARSIRYGHMVEQVRGIEAVLADGRHGWLGPGGPPMQPAPTSLQAAMQALYARESEELERRLPRVPRHVAGYALHRLGHPGATLADLLVGSEGTLAFFTALELRLHPIPAGRALGVCRFPSVRSALAAVPALVSLDPTAVELVDRTLLELADRIPAFRAPLHRALGDEGTVETARLPGAILLIELAGPDAGAVRTRLDDLEEVARQAGATGLLKAETAGLQAEIWGVRKAGLNIATSMKAPRKPIAFIEDCVIPLDRLPEWHDRLSAVVESAGTRAIWYAHASVGCLHVRPALDLKQPDDVRAMRAIAEQAFSIAHELGGSHSGEHGDGIIRSEFTERMLGSRLVRAFEEVKATFDPAGLLNPGRVVLAPRMDDRRLFRYSPDYRPEPFETTLDWSEWGGLAGAIEMCNNNGACRQRDPGVMCPSFRATADERHSTRGRANALRLTLSGQLGEGGWASPELHEAMDLCIGCKACRRECPTGVDMARMKIEYLHRRRRDERPGARDRAIAYLPRVAPWASRVPRLANTRNRFPWLASLGERALGLAAARRLPSWSGRPFGRRGDDLAAGGRGDGSGARRVVLFVDTFSRYFEPENARAAIRVLRATGLAVEVPEQAGRPACCGRTFLNAGLVDEARVEMSRLVRRYLPYASRGIPVVGLEPSCLLTLRDELVALLPGEDARTVAGAARLFQEVVADRADRLAPGPLPRDGTTALVHGHCHEKAFGLQDATLTVLRRVPGLAVEPIRAGCCGMAGSFGYEAEHAELSRRIGELDLLPAVREADPAAWIVANGTSCRHQIGELGGREALHVARVLDAALASA